MITLNRRRVISENGEDPNRFTLLYEWEASRWTDDNSAWGDSISGYNLSKNGSPTKGADDGAYIVVNTSNYFYRPGNTNLPMPRNWMWEITFMRTIAVTGKNWYLVDFGSLGSATNGGIGLYVTPAGNFGINCKPTNNTVVGNVSLAAGIEDNIKYTVRMGCQQYSSTQDVQWIEFNGVKVTATTPHSPFANLSKPALGRYFGKGCYSGNAYSDGTGRLYDIKIYTDTQTV